MLSPHIFVAGVVLALLGLYLLLRLHQWQHNLHKLRQTELFTPSELQDLYQRSQLVQNTSLRLPIACYGKIAAKDLPTTPYLQIPAAAFYTRIYRMSSRHQALSKHLVYEKQHHQDFYLADEEQTVWVKAGDLASCPIESLHLHDQHFQEEKPQQPLFPLPVDQRKTQGFEVEEQALAEDDKIYVYGELHNRHEQLCIAAPLKGGQLIVSRLPLQELLKQFQRNKLDDLHSGVFLVILGCAGIAQSLFPDVFGLPDDFPPNVLLFFTAIVFLLLNMAARVGFFYTTANKQNKSLWLSIGLLLMSFYA